uniref:Glycoside hydrolase family 19 catalytic domain-containing protein n=1 Tax=Romanomermis culicivorax TaxID=13658 RepID=A0A915JWJ1_ROMCU
LPPSQPGLSPEDGDRCSLAGRYCVAGPDCDAFFPCNTEQEYSSKNYSSIGGGNTDEFIYKGCYFGRGAIQISYNYNYGQFQRFLFEQGLDIDLLNEPNLLITKRDPPLAIMASLWFYMTPQPPKPAMHDIII